jgi:hypothetical protein
MMALADIEWVLEEAYRLCDDHGVPFDAYPMHEMAAHPRSAVPSRTAARAMTSCGSVPAASRAG